MANVVGEMSCTLAEAPNREAISADNCVDGYSCTIFNQNSADASNPFLPSFRV